MRIYTEQKLARDYLRRLGTLSFSKCYWSRRTLKVILILRDICRNGDISVSLQRLTNRPARDLELKRCTWC